MRRVVVVQRQPQLALEQAGAAAGVDHPARRGLLQRFTRTLPAQLVQRTGLAQLHLAHDGAVDQLFDKLVAEAFDVEGELQAPVADELDQRLQRTARAADTGKESRLIDCEWTWREDGVMVLRRTDNGEEIEKRFASAEEIEAFAQGKLFGGSDRTVN